MRRRLPYTAGLRVITFSVTELVFSHSDQDVCGRIYALPELQ